jgi:thiamine biosynthesis lipoprotein
MTNFSFTLSTLGTTWWIELFTPIDEASRQVVKDDLAACLQTFEQRYSRFKPDSLVSRLNREGYVENPDNDLIEILTYGKKLYQETAGAFNFLLGNVMNARGYDQDYSFTPQAYSDQRVPSPDQDLNITDAKITLSHGAIDLGGFGKGYVIDQLANRLQTIHHIPEFLINGGGDIFATSEHGEPVTIYLEHPLDPSIMLGTAVINNQGFASSSPHKRQWTKDQTTYHHIIDTKEIDRLTVTANASFVIAPKTALADAYATVLLGRNNTAVPTTIATARYQLDTNTLIHDRQFPLTLFS